MQISVLSIICLNASAFYALMFVQFDGAYRPVAENMAADCLECAFLVLSPFLLRLGSGASGRRAG